MTELEKIQLLIKFFKEKYNKDLPVEVTDKEIEEFNTWLHELTPISTT